MLKLIFASGGIFRRWGRRHGVIVHRKDRCIVGMWGGSGAYVEANGMKQRLSGCRLE